MPDIAGLLLDATRRLKEAGIEGPRQDAVLLLSEAAGLSPDRVRLQPETALAPDIAARFEALMQRRLAREPVSQILGRREFWGLDFHVTRDVLDPRPDSETLVAGALAAISDRGAAWRIVDFGTGSGCLLLSLLHELPNATGLGVDASPAALEIARGNAEQLGLASRVDFRQGDWGTGLEGPFDILISNPPYIESAVVPELAPEVARHEPRLALDGGADGLDAYRRLVPHMARLAAPGAFAALEIGLGQDAAVSALLAGAGFAGIVVLPDLAGVGRVVTGRKSR
ncbi:peptide chain release factor N(5)-glutamine methyltransferase [Ferrovibrio sp.]|jgi:release factor glutamine methyltransferase|uniref:peptide chain release factor N(5)-glutamine methyltransferase n=1 Tax=Ferrovibrio sp. TaxID=1917215 RepID=UPI0035B1D8BC